jgi:hypothetical protein
MPPVSIRSLLKKYAAALGMAGFLGIQLGALAMVCPGMVGIGAEAYNEVPSGPPKTAPAQMDILNKVCRKATLA